MKRTDTALPKETLWEQFSQKYGLTHTQLTQFQAYYDLCVQWNSDICNLTAITALPEFIESHLEDSLSLALLHPLDEYTALADVGTGGGFPAIPLKILYPHLSFYLIEVTAKKRQFLAHVIQALALTSMVIIESDWRTFLRSTTFDIELFCSRAALQPKELIRMFKPSCFYKNRSLVYWAGKGWVATDEEKAYILKECCYSLGEKQRRLVFFLADIS